jgi:hypothetical protein
MSEVGTHNFFLSLQSQFCHLKEAQNIAIPQLFKEILLRNAAITIFSEVRNLRAPIPQFSAYFCCGVALNYSFFYRRVFFAIERILKGR